MRFKFTAIALLSLSLTSCKLMESYKQEKESCNALIAQRDSLAKAYEGLPFGEITEIGEASLSRLDSIMTMLETHKVELSKEDAIFLGRYRGISKPFRKLDEYQYNLEYDLDFSKNQLADLLQDIENKATAKDTIQLFIQEEKAALERIADAINRLKQQKELMAEEFAKNEEEINRILKTLNAK